MSQSNTPYGNTVEVGTDWVQVFPSADGVARIPDNGVLLRVPENYSGSANTKTAVWSDTNSSSSSNKGIDIAFGDAGTVNETLIRKEVLQNANSKIYVKGSASATPVSVTIQ